MICGVVEGDVGVAGTLSRGELVVCTEEAGAGVLDGLEEWPVGAGRDPLQGGQGTTKIVQKAFVIGKRSPVCTMLDELCMLDKVFYTTIPAILTIGTSS